MGKTGRGAGLGAKIKLDLYQFEILVKQLGEYGHILANGSRVPT